MAKTFKAMQSSTLGQKVLSNNYIETEEEYKEWLNETKAIYKSGTCTEELAHMEGLTVDELKSIIL